MNIYCVTMYRYGDKEKHSYLLGVYSSFKEALYSAKLEESYRGGKYLSEIRKLMLDCDIYRGYNDVLYNGCY